MPRCLMQCVLDPLGGDEAGVPGGRLCVLCHRPLQPICQHCRWSALASQLHDPVRTIQGQHRAMRVWYGTAQLTIMRPSVSDQIILVSNQLKQKSVNEKTIGVNWGSQAFGDFNKNLPDLTQKYYLQTSDISLLSFLKIRQHFNGWYNEVTFLSQMYHSCECKNM